MEDYEKKVLVKFINQWKIGTSGFSIIIIEGREIMDHIDGVKTHCFIFAVLGIGVFIGFNTKLDNPIK